MDSFGKSKLVDRQILGLALPALGALITEPLLMVADSAMIGHLGAAQLAGLSLASTLLLSLVGLFLFLAYTTTATTARKLGSGDQDGALQSGIDGIWLAGSLGLICSALLLCSAGTLTQVLGATGHVAQYATDYLRASAPGVIGMFLILAATGTLRGLLNTRTPLQVAIGGCLANIALNALLIYGFNLGITGAGLGTALAQTGMAATLLIIIFRASRGRRVSFKPSLRAIGTVGRAGFPLFLRTISMRLVLLVTVLVATQLGTVTLAAHQIINTVWFLGSFALDALAIAAQALVGYDLGTKNIPAIRAISRRCILWGMGSGLILGLAIAAGANWIPRAFSTDPAVCQAAIGTLMIIALFQPLAGLVFVLDGILMGAGDGNYLAVAGFGTLLLYLPGAFLVLKMDPGTDGGLALIWIAFGTIFMGTRALANWIRFRRDRWMRLAS